MRAGEEAEMVMDKDARDAGWKEKEKPEDDGC
jgi:hypothetical protein